MDVCYELVSFANRTFLIVTANFRFRFIFGILCRFLLLSTYLALSGPQVVQRSAKKFLQAATTSLWWTFLSLILHFIVFLQAYPWASNWWPAWVVYCQACALRSTCPHQLLRRILITSTTDCWPVLFLSSISLTWSYQRIFIMTLKHPLSNLLTLFSISFRTFQKSHPYIRTNITILLNSLSFVEGHTLCAFQTMFCILNAAPAFSLLLPTKCLSNKIFASHILFMWTCQMNFVSQSSSIHSG